MKNVGGLTHAILSVAIAILCVWPLSAQEESDSRPKPAAHQYSAFADLGDQKQGADQTTGTYAPDTLPLSGFQNPTIGSPEMRHSYWVPGIQYSNLVSSSPQGAQVNSGWNTTNFLSTNLSLLEAWGNSSLSANYSGGGYSSSAGDPRWGQYQQLAAQYELDRKRWQAVLLEAFSYLPQSSFGFGGTSGLSSPGVAGSLGAPVAGLQSGYIPGQGVLTATGSRYSNSSAAQFTYRTGARGSITVAGLYAILRFVEPGNVNSDTEMASLGYDYILSRSDTVGASYRFGAYRYPGNPQALGDHVWQLEYGRKITGRMGLKLTGGPELTTLRIPIGNVTQRLSGSASASILYTIPNGNFDLRYVHGVDAGSGVFTGASSDQIIGTLNKRLTRAWSGHVSFGYARNTQILGAIGSPVYDSWTTGAGLDRPFGHMATVSLGYQAQIQAGNVTTGATNYTSHQIFLTFQWHTRPFVLR